MVQAILGTYEHYIDDITIIPSRGGAFEVTVGDNLVYSKLDTGRHATIDEVMDSVDAILGPVPDPQGS
jgi:selenoprotein W-related protein